MKKDRGLALDGLPRLHSGNLDVLQSQLVHFLAQRLWGSGQHGEGAEVHGNDHLRLEEFDGIGRFARGHGEVIANGQQNGAGVIEFADQRHIAKYACVTGMVEDFAVFQFNYIASGDAAIDDGIAVVDAAAMVGVNHSYADAIDVLRAADVHAGAVFHALAAQPAAEFRDADDGGGFGLFADSDGISDVVEVAVCYEHQIHVVDLFLIFGARRIALHPGIDQDLFAARCREFERGMAEPGKLVTTVLHGDTLSFSLSDDDNRLPNLTSSWCLVRSYYIRLRLAARASKDFPIFATDLPGLKRIKEGLKVWRQGSLKGQWMTCNRMGELEFGSMQKDSRRLQRLRAAIQPITDDGMTDGREVHANLMGAARDNLHAQQAKGLEFAFHPEEGLRVAAMLGGDGHTLPVALVAPDGRFDCAFGQRQATLHERQVAFGDGVLLKLLGKLRHGGGCFGNDEQPGRIFIQPVEIGRAMLAARVHGLGNSRVARQQEISQGVVFVACGRMHNQSRRFVDNQKVLILEEDVEWQGWLPDHPRFDFWYWRLHQDGIARLQLVAGSGRTVVEQNSALLDERLNPGARKMRQMTGDEHIDALIARFGVGQFFSGSIAQIA